MQGGQAIGKADDEEEARAILRRLCGTRHEVITGLALLGPGGVRLIASEVTHVTMRKASEGEIQAYLDSGEWRGKAGAYAIQETGDRFVECVEGSFSNVVGLPMELLGTGMTPRRGPEVRRNTMAAQRKPRSRLPMHARPIALMAAAVLAAAAGGCSSRPGPAAASASVKISGHTWKVEIARTTQDRYQGLSDRPRVPEGTGMLFVYPRAQLLSFCMRRCLVGLDIAFLDAQGRVVSTYTMRVEPYDQEQEAYSSIEPAQYALEVAAGELARAGVKKGDRADFFSIPDPAKAEAGP
jgi:uncharacterized membrane protein (UPF0127 family)